MRTCPLSSSKAIRSPLGLIAIALAKAEPRMRSVQAGGMRSCMPRAGGLAHPSVGTTTASVTVGDTEAPSKSGFTSQSDCLVARPAWRLSRCPYLQRSRSEKPQSANSVQCLHIATIAGCGPWFDGKNYSAELPERFEIPTGNSQRCPANLRGRKGKDVLIAPRPRIGKRSPNFNIYHKVRGGCFCISPARTAERVSSEGLGRIISLNCVIERRTLADDSRAVRNASWQARVRLGSPFALALSV